MSKTGSSVSTLARLAAGLKAKRADKRPIEERDDEGDDMDAPDEPMDDEEGDEDDTGKATKSKKRAKDEGEDEDDGADEDDYEDGDKKATSALAQRIIQAGEVAAGRREMRVTPPPQSKPVKMTAKAFFAAVRKAEGLE
jgi:hypothetical protein